jgi:hypothetical protein
MAGDRGAVLAASPTPGSEFDKFTDTIGEQERTVQTKIISTGLNGGELLLTDLSDNPTKSPFEGLKVGQWVMLCGPHPNSNAIASGQGEPRFALNWYQVLSIDAERAAGVITNPARQRVIAVRGPQWPWQPASSPTAKSVSNNLCLAICNGAVAVHTKTLRLQGSASGLGDPWDVYSPTTPEPPGNVYR